MGTGSGELGNTGEGACASDVIQSLRETFAGAYPGALNQVMDGGGNPGHSASGSACPESPQERCKGNVGGGEWGLKKREL